MRKLAIVFIGCVVGAAALVGVLAYTNQAATVRKATSASAVWAYYGGVGWATDEGIACESALLVDQQTGVMYLMTKTSNDVDVTVLLNADGTPRKQVE
jgi:hypothetical protein